MAIKKSTLIYKRDKDKIEITGDPKDIKWPMWFDLVSSKVLWVLFVVALLFTVPKASIIPVLWQWVKKLLPFTIPFMVRADWLQMLFSG